MSINLERRGFNVVVTLDRPDKLNALSAAMLDELREAFNEVETLPDARCVILTGAGERAFSAGTDLGELISVSADKARDVAHRGQTVCNQIERCSVPVIAAINGIAAGAGCELALASHIRVASSRASFSLPETRLGIVPGYGGTQRLAREIGNGRALEIILTGRTVGAEEALRLGLVSRVTDGNVLDEAESIARDIKQLAPLAIRACLQAVTRGTEMSLKEGLELEAELFAGLFATDDMREGTRAFLEKRKPVFKGR